MSRIDSATRIIEASPEAVYAAMTTAEALAAWLPPDGMSGQMLEFDPRPGGHYAMVLRHDDGAAAGKSGGNEARPAEPAEGATSLRRAAVYEDLSPAFVINYRQGNRQRYLQVSIALMARDEERLKALRVHMPVLRNELVMLLSGQDFDSLLTPVGKEMLRQQATAKVQELALKETGHQVVEQVLFTNLVLQ